MGLMNQQPYEIIAGPVRVYLADAGTSKPDIDDDTLTGWTQIGTDGNKNYDEGGVTVQHKSKCEIFRPMGSTGPRKAWRTEEDLMIKLKVADVSLEEYAKALNYNTVSEDSGRRTIGLSRGPNVVQKALLVRTASPYGDDLFMQYWVPRVYEGSSPDVQFQKGKPAMLSLEFGALEDLEASEESELFGVLEAQDGTT